jgi:hypothetical protein
LTETMAQNLESVPPGEEQAIDTIVALALGELRKRYPAGAPLVRRDAHAKAHGCVKAIFRVDDNLTANLRVGTFSTPGQEFRAWVRYSNGAFEPGADTGMDGRGMAVKILEPPSPGLSSPPAPGEGPAAAATTHDILMINYPVFFSPGAVDYADFAKSGALTGDSSGLRRYFCSFLHQSAKLARAARIDCLQHRQPEDFLATGHSVFLDGPVSVWSRACGQILCAPMPGCS